MKLPSLLLFSATVATGLLPSPLFAQEPLVNGKPLSAIVTARIDAPQAPLWAGEVFTFTRSVAIAGAAFGSVSPDFEWTPPGVVLEDWTSPVRSSIGPREGVTTMARAYVRGSGTVSLPDSTQPVTLVTGRAGDGSALTDNYAVPVTAPRLIVQPLPRPEPAGFANAVGTFALTSTLSATTVKPGESLTWTLELSGTGNWPEISRLPPRVVSKDFTAIAPVLKRDIKPGTLFDGTLTEDIILVPTKPGQYQLGPVRFIYFDPKRSKYQMITTETFVVTVGGKPAGASRPTETDQVGGIGGARQLIPGSPPVLPLDPLPLGTHALTPFSPHLQTAVGVIVALAVAAYWLSLAARRSQETDPLHPRRRARAQLEAALAALDKNTVDPAGLRRLLFAWQKAVIEFAGLRLATPTAANVAQAIEKIPNTIGSSWAPLWRDANAALYGESGRLPADWVMRARAALSEQSVDPVPFRARFFRRNLLPFAAIALLAIVPTPRARADGLASYRKGDFAGAEQEWRRALAVSPLDSGAHYNLALAAAQQNRWPESLAQSLAAFCLAPRNPAIRWQLALSMDRAGIDNPVFSRFVTGQGRYRIARLFSPGEWALVRMLALFACGAATIVGLTTLYRRGRGLALWMAATAASASVVVIVLTGLSISCYGPLGEDNTAIVARSVLLCSVPTEIDTTQKTVPLPAGSIASIDSTFLGWTRLVFPNHQTGWARSDALVPLYR